MKEFIALAAAVIGFLIGLSCWLRANTLLLAPFLAILIIILLRRRRVASCYYAAVLVGVTILVVAPITLRNLIVFKRFIPIQLGSGVTLIEGIADYDTGRLVVVEFNTPQLATENDSRIAARILELRNQGQALPTGPGRR